MDLKSLTYTSLAKLDLDARDLEAIQHSAQQWNALNGITGLLIFNGTHFLQIIEGAEAAIDELLDRLLRDQRHSGLEVRDTQMIHERSFSEWSMELVRVEATYFEARETISCRIPSTVSAEVRDRIDRFTKAISGIVRI